MKVATIPRAGWATACLLLALSWPVAAVADRRDVRREAAPYGSAWRPWDSGLKEAARTGRPVLVDVYTDWCGWCKRMERDTYSRPAVRDYLGSHYVTVRLNPESSKAAWEVANRFRITGYPTTVFLKPSGEHLITVPGYVAAPRFLTLLRYIAEGHLERQVPFETFRRQIEEQP